MREKLKRGAKSFVGNKSLRRYIGHVFCSSLAVVLRKELQDRIARKGWKLEWSRIIDDVDAIEEITVHHQNLVFRLRTEAAGVAGKVFQAAGVALPPVLRDGPPEG